MTSLSRDGLPLVCFQSFWHIIFYCVTCHVESVQCSLRLRIEEVLASIKKLFSCHKDDRSAYNDQADVVQWDIC